LSISNPNKWGLYRISIGPELIQHLIKFPLKWESD
jgi:hypothetical protein